jgi:hypothetical protein
MLTICKHTPADPLLGMGILQLSPHVPPTPSLPPSLTRKHHGIETHRVVPLLPASPPISARPGAS